MKPVNTLPDPKNRIAFSILERLIFENKKEIPLVSESLAQVAPAKRHLHKIFLHNNYR